MNTYINTYKYEYSKKDKLTGKVLDYTEASVEKSNFPKVFDHVLANHFYKDEMADGEYYYQVTVYRLGHTGSSKTREERIYLNNEELRVA